MLYDAAMDRTNYWHLKPDEDVQELQREYYSIFSSDVDCEVSYSSQYLLSLYYVETYAPANPVWYVSMTKRGRNVDLLTGEDYELSDIIRVERDFLEFWAARAHGVYEDFFDLDEEGLETLLIWFTKGNEEWDAYYAFEPYFYVTDDKEFVVGLSINPKFISPHEPQEDYYEIRCGAEELEAFRTESEFWKQYELSEPAGEVRQCKGLHNNLWLGDLGGVWDYWEERGALFRE